MYAKVLMVVAVLTAGAAVWTDPELRADTTRQVETLRPVAASLLVGTPFEDLLGPAVANDAPESQALTEDQLADATNVTFRRVTAADR